MKTLGIFVGTDCFPEYFQALAEAAGEKGLIVRLHFFASGVRLVTGTDFDRLPRASKVTICRQSAARLHLDDGSDTPWRRWLVPPGYMARILKECDRHLFV
jgi:hypothetical protein